MKHYLHRLFLFFFVYSQPFCYGQQENIWLFGSSGLDFNYVNPSPISSPLVFNEGCATISDTNGRLLFSTDGGTVWDRNFTTMANGIILPSRWTSSTSQGALIVPMPDSTHKYYIFSLTCYELGADLGRLYYSVVNMNLNNGLGGIESGQKTILLDTFLTEHLTGVLGDQCNMWVVVSSRKEQAFKSFEITGSGINRVPVVSRPGGANTSYYIFGKMTISPDRRKLAIGRSSALGGAGSLELYSFNPYTGLVSEPLLLDPNYRSYYGISFSPDNTKLYANGDFKSIVQFDLSSGNLSTIASSRILLGASYLTDIQRGPDGLVYFVSDAGYLSVIGAPNRAGNACQFSPAKVFLNGGGGGLGLPNLVPVSLKKDTSISITKHKAPCFAIQSLLTASDTSGWSYSWSNGSVGNTLAVAQAGTYWVSYHTSPCVFHIDTFVVAFPGGVVPVIDLNSSCFNEITGKAWVKIPSWDTVRYHYTWCSFDQKVKSNADTLMRVASGNYTLQIQTHSGCDTTFSFFIPEASHQVSFGMDSIVCINESVVFENTSDPYFETFNWCFGDESDSQFSEPFHVYRLPGYFRIRLVGRGGDCSDTSYANITVDTPFANLSFTKDRQAVCVGERLSFLPLTDNTILRLNWSYGDDGGVISLPISPVQHAYDKAGIMPVWLTAEARACPPITVRDSVIVYPLPLVNLGRDSVLCLNTEALSLSNKAPGNAGKDYYLWSTGATTPEIKVREKGLYTLSVINEYTCRNSETIRISKDCYIDIPNAFTPNGDGENDYFFLRQLLSSSITRFSMKIWNRWGQLLFESRNGNGKGWDGRFNGSSQPQGVYLYHVEVEFNNGKEEHYKGNVTLIR